MKSISSCSGPSDSGRCSPSSSSIFKYSAYDGMGVLGRARAGLGAAEERSQPTARREGPAGSQPPRPKKRDAPLARGVCWVLCARGLLLFLYPTAVPAQLEAAHAGEA